MTTPVDTYREAGHRMLAQARDELRASDLVQASEKGWGAAVKLVKAAAETRGWIHDSHRHLFVVVRDLAEQAGDPDLSRLFANVNYLHVNFYEETLPAGDVAFHLDRAAEFVAKVDALLEP